MSKHAEFKIELCKCRDCGRFGIMLVEDEGSSYRMSGHKCSGSWMKGDTYKCSLPDEILKRLLESAK